MNRSPKDGSDVPGLSHAALDAIALVAGISRTTVTEVLLIRARSEPYERALSEAEKRLLVAAEDVTIGRGELVYFIQAERSGRIKIGTTRNLDQRIRVLQASSPVPLRVIGFVRGGKHMERMLHMAFAPLRWGRSEWFEPGERLLSYIRELHEEGGS